MRVSYFKYKTIYFFVTSFFYLGFTTIHALWFYNEKSIVLGQLIIAILTGILSYIVFTFILKKVYKRSRFVNPHAPLLFTTLVVAFFKIIASTIEFELLNVSYYLLFVSLFIAILFDE